MRVFLSSPILVCSFSHCPFDKNSLRRINGRYFQVFLLFLFILLRLQRCVSSLRDFPICFTLIHRFVFRMFFFCFCPP